MSIRNMPLCVLHRTTRLTPLHRLVQKVRPCFWVLWGAGTSLQGRPGVKLAHIRPPLDFRTYSFFRAFWGCSLSTCTHVLAVQMPVAGQVMCLLLSPQIIRKEKKGLFVLQEVSLGQWRGSRRRKVDTPYLFAREGIWDSHWGMSCGPSQRDLAMGETPVS